MTTAAPSRERRKVESASRPGHFYEMERGAGSWYHVDVGCEWNYFRHDNAKPCEHVNELNKESGMTTTAVSQRSPNRNLPTMIEEFDTSLIMQGVQPEVVEKWGYAFPMKQDGQSKTVEGLSVLGVQAAVRWSAKNGEPIATIDCHIAYEDENEARFVATAVRFAVVPRPEGAIERVELDRTIRAKRQAKWGRRAESGEPYYIENWFEIGYSKACRNAENALLTDQAKTAILQAVRTAREALKKGGGRQASEPERSKPNVERNEAIAAIRRDLGELQKQFPDVYAKTRDSIKARYPHSLDREGRFVASKLKDGEHEPVAKLVKEALEQANGGPGPDLKQPSLMEKAAEQAAPEEAAEEETCSECDRPAAMYDADATPFCEEHGRVDD